MAELKDTAEQFAKDLAAQNIGGLMMVFTPAGMGKAMALQAQMAAAGPRQPATSTEVNLMGAEGASQLVDVVMKGPDGDVTLATKWVDVAGAWKVDDMAVKA